VAAVSPLASDAPAARAGSPSRRLAGILGATAIGPQRFTSKIEAVRVDVLVTERGKPVRGLQASDFELVDNGVRQQVDLAGFEQPLNVILALDMSGSVAGARLDDLRQAGRSVLNGLRTGDRAALVTFSHLVVLRSELTTDLARVRAALDNLAGAGDTALIDGTYVAMMLGEEDVGRSLLMIFGDGLDTSSWLTSDAVVGTARRSDVVAYGVSVGGTTSAFLRELAAATGGRSIDLESTKALGTTFVGILEEFRGRYVISFSPRGVRQDDGWHRLQVRVKGRNGAVKARPGYFAGR